MFKATFMGVVCEVFIDAERNPLFPRIQLVVGEAGGSLAGDELMPGEPFVTASTAMDYWLLQGGEVAIKAYNENAGIVESLVAGGIVHPAHIHLDLRGARVPGPRRVSAPDNADAYVAICRFTDEVIAAIPALRDEDEDEDAEVE